MAGADVCDGYVQCRAVGYRVVSLNACAVATAVFGKLVMTWQICNQITKAWFAAGKTEREAREREKPCA